MKRRKFLKMLPVGLLVSRFGGLLDPLFDLFQKSNAVPVRIVYQGGEVFEQMMIPYHDENGKYCLRSVPSEKDYTELTGMEFEGYS